MNGLMNNGGNIFEFPGGGVIVSQGRFQRTTYFDYLEVHIRTYVHRQKVYIRFFFQKYKYSILHLNSITPSPSKTCIRISIVSSNSKSSFWMSLAVISNPSIMLSSLGSLLLWCEQCFNNNSSNNPCGSTSSGERTNNSFPGKLSGKSLDNW